jgi:hypothetical protein
MRAVALLAPALVALGCGAPGGSTRTCGDVKPSVPVLVLERESSGQSGLARLDTDGCLTETPDVALGTDPALCPAHGAPYVCARDTGLVLEIDPSDAHVVRSMKAYQSGEGRPCGAAVCSNPHGVDVDASGRLWVARYDQASLAVLGPSGAFQQAVDLFSLAGPTGLPQMEAVRVHEGHAFVALQRLPALDCVPPTVPAGEVAVIDTATPGAPSTFALQGHNPLGRFEAAPVDASGAWVSIATPGSFAEATSTSDGVELVDLSTRTSRVAVTEQALGGSVVEAVVVGPTEGYAIVAEADSPDCRTARNATFLARFDPSAGTLTAVLADTRASTDPGFYYQGLAVAGDRVVLGDRTPSAARLRFFDRATGAVAGEMEPKSLPPAAVLALP